jgi:SPOR domain
MRFGGGGDAVNDGGAALPWLVIREDDNGNRYRVGRFATQGEAQRAVEQLDATGHKQLYWVVRADQSPAQDAV